MREDADRGAVMGLSTSSVPAGRDPVGGVPTRDIGARAARTFVPGHRTPTRRIPARRYLLVLCNVALLAAVGCREADDGRDAEETADADAGREADAGEALEPEAPPTPACFRSAPPGAFIGGAGCLQAFEACDGTPGHYLLVADGPDQEFDLDGIKAVKTELEPVLFALPGVDMVGLSKTCCDETTNAACIWVHVQQNVKLGINRVVQALAEIACAQAGCFGITVEIPPPGEPRCDEGPDCLPLPMCEPQRCDPLDACCPVCREYDPDGERKPAIGELVPGSLGGLEDPLHEQDGECAHDGDCVQNGCSQYCSSYEDPMFVSSCECYPGLSVAHCGCVDGRCQWFYQVE